MKLAKIAGLATLAALALAMSLGAGSASAWGFCKEKSKEALCPAPYIAGTVYSGSLEAGAKLARFTGHIEASCASAGWEFKQTSEPHATPVGEMTPVAFGSCSRTVTAVNLPWRIEVEDVSGGKGTWLAKISSSGKGAPGVIIGEACTYTATTMQFEFLDTSVTGGKATMSGEIPLTGSGICASEVMTVKYVVSSPTSQIWPG
ncbi:MAG TPA: hypothetical protein VGI73_07790 [Solirubrobacterales bacterium]|jgi:hypothetical protein